MKCPKCGTESREGGGCCPAFRIEGGSIGDGRLDFTWYTHSPWALGVWPSVPLVADRLAAK